MNRILPLLALSLAVAACSNSTSTKKTASNNASSGGTDNGATTGGATDGDGGVSSVDANTNPIDNVGQVSAVMETDQYSDGPTWSQQGGALYFTTPLGNGGLFRMLPDGRTIQTRVGDSTKGTQPIGTTVLSTGDIITAEAKDVTKTTSAAALNNPDSVVTAGYDPASNPASNDPYAPAPPPAGTGQFDTLNDVVARKDGTLYMTDPGYFVPGGPAVNRIFRTDTSGHTFIVDAFEDIPHPNGIALSPDEKTLYVGFSSPSGVAPYIRKYTVNDDGTLGAQTKFIDLGADAAPDGLGIDVAGNVYVCASDGIEVYKPTGEKWGIVAVPEIPTGVTFGGTDGKTLYITTQGSHIFQITTKLAGLAQ